MSPSTQPTEFRYRSDGGRFAAFSLLAVAGLFFLASLITGAWGVAALLHASWLNENDLPFTHSETWGVGLLVLASIQGLTALLLLFNLRIATLMGVAITVLNLLSHVAVISAYPVWSIAAILVNLVILYVLVAFRRRD